MNREVVTCNCHGRTPDDYDPECCEIHRSSAPAGRLSSELPPWWEVEAMRRGAPSAETRRLLRDAPCNCAAKKPEALFPAAHSTDCPVFIRSFAEHHDLVPRGFTPPSAPAEPQPALFDLSFEAFEEFLRIDRANRPQLGAPILDDAGAAAAAMRQMQPLIGSDARGEDDGAPNSITPAAILGTIAVALALFAAGFALAVVLW